MKKTFSLISFITLICLFLIAGYANARSGLQYSNPAYLQHVDSVCAVDTDQDGISDAQETIDGTDPDDPGDASAWHPEIDEYPRLFADAQRWEEVKQEILADGQSAASLFARVVLTADAMPQEQVPGVYSFSILMDNSNIAAAAALAAFVLDDDDYGQKAYEITSQATVELAQLPLDQWDNGTIQGGQAMVMFCLAYDLLTGFLLVDDAQSVEMESAILAMADKLYFLYVTIPIGRIIQNNHLIKLAAGLGVVGMTLNRNRDAAKYVNFSLSSGPYVLFDFQMPDGGGQGEGPNYLDYTFTTFLPFAQSYHRYAQGESLPYKTDCRVCLLRPCESVIEMVPDPVADPRMNELLDWRMGIIMPNGYAPPIDDSNLSCGHSGVIAALFERADYAWHYENSQKCKNNTHDLASLQLALLDQMPEPQQPQVGPSLIFEGAGQAMLRSGWDENAHYALLNGEHGKARRSGIGHEQPDASNFILFAGGEMLAMDSGYISYDERWKVIHARNHNLILVDDLGPTIGLYFVFADSDAYLSDLVDDPIFKSVRVRTSYQSADFTRRLVLIGQEYFITMDQVESTTVRDYSWLMQTNAGGTTNGVFTLMEDGGVIEQTGIAMRSYLQSLPPIDEVWDYEEEHGFRHGQTDYHTVMRGEVTARKANILGLHLTADTPEEFATVEKFTANRILAYYIEGDDYLDAFIYNTGGAFSLSEDECPVGSVDSNGYLVWVRIDPETGESLHTKRLGGTYLELGGILQD